MDRKEIKKAIDKFYYDKAADVDGINAEMLKYGGETMVECMFMICDLE